jgi:hypothetical protein
MNTNLRPNYSRYCVESTSLGPEKDQWKAPVNMEMNIKFPQNKLSY